MIKPRRKTLLAVCVAVPSLVGLATQCPLNLPGTSVSGTGFSATCTPWDNDYETFATYLSPTREEVTLTGHNAYKVCSGSSLVYIDQQGPIRTTAMTKSAHWIVNQYKEAASSVSGPGYAVAMVVGVP